MRLTRRQFAGGAAIAFAAQASIGSAVAQGATLKIGMVHPVTGPGAEQGHYALTGAKIAVAKVNKAGGVLGKQVELVAEDDQTSNPGAVLAFSKLASQSDIVGFLAPIRSTQVHAIAPDIMKLGKPVMFGGSDPRLTRLGNPWLFRCRPNDTYSARVIADFGIGTLGKKKWAIVHSTDSFGTAGGKALSAALATAGAEVVLDQGYSNQSQDFTPVVLTVKRAAPDILGSYFTFENDQGIFARQMRQFGVAMPYVGSASIASVTALKLGGRALFGTYGVIDYAETSSPAAKEFGRAYREVARMAPDIQSSWTYDAVNVLCAAIGKAGKTDPDAVRSAILATKGFAGAEGEYNFDANGDGLHGYNVVKNEGGRIVFAKHIEFKD